MAGSALAVRDATPEDVPDLLELWTELRDLGGRYERALPHPTREGVLARLHEASANPRLRVLVAVSPGQVVGVAVLTVQPLAALFEAPAVHVDYLHTRRGHRRRGVGHALLTAAAAFAEEVGAEHVVTSVYPHLRDAQRFYARLGFGPMYVRRVAPVTTLRRTLAGAAAGRAARTADRLLVRRRSVRARTPAVALRAAPR